MKVYLLYSILASGLNYFATLIVLYFLGTTSFSLLYAPFLYAFFIGQLGDLSLENQFISNRLDGITYITAKFTFYLVASIFVYTLDVVDTFELSIGDLFFIIVSWYIFTCVTAYLKKLNKFRELGIIILVAAILRTFVMLILLLLVEDDVSRYIVLFFPLLALTSVAVFAVLSTDSFSKAHITFVGSRISFKSISLAIVASYMIQALYGRLDVYVIERYLTDDQLHLYVSALALFAPLFTVIDFVCTYAFRNYKTILQKLPDRYSTGYILILYLLILNFIFVGTISLLPIDAFFKLVLTGCVALLSASISGFFHRIIFIEASANQLLFLLLSAFQFMILYTLALLVVEWGVYFVVLSLVVGNLMGAIGHLLMMSKTDHNKLSI